MTYKKFASHESGVGQRRERKIIVESEPEAMCVCTTRLQLYAEIQHKV
jgi:hypothetical protein